MVNMVNTGGSGGTGSFFSDTNTAPPSFGGLAGGPVKPDTSVGKFTLDLTNPVGSVGDIAGGIGKLVGGVGGGALGLLGQIGVPGGPTLGDVPGAIGQGLGAIGSIGVPGGPNVGGVVAGAVNALGAPERAVERTIAGQRVEAAQNHGQFGPLDTLPPDLQAKLDAGASVSDVADELVARNAGFSNNPLLNLAGGLVFDPLNLIAPGVGKIGTLAGHYGTAIRTAEEAAKLNVGEKYVGAAYNGLMRGLPAAMGATMDKLLGGTTSAIFHSIGSRPYQAIKSGLAQISEDAASRWDAAMGKFSTQETVAAMQQEIGTEVQKRWRSAENATAEDVQQALAKQMEVNPSNIARNTENLLDRVKPLFTGMSQADRRAWAIPRLAEIGGVSVEDAQRILPKTLDDSFMQNVHGAFYGQAGGDLAGVKAALEGDQAARAIIPNLDRLTVIGDSHLTQERAANLLAMLKRGDPAALDEARKYDALQRYVVGAPDAVEAKLKDLLPKITDQLPQAVRQATSGKNPLPAALGAWRAKYAPLGYDLGFAPESGIKVLEDAKGGVPDLFIAPFVHFVDQADKLNVANPLGRTMDALFRGVTQTKIITSSRNRMVKVASQYGMSEGEAKAFHRAVINTAIDRGENIRGLAANDYRRVLEDLVGPGRYHELSAKVDPIFLVMKAFEGNLREVGLTQKITGKLKTATAERGNLVGTLAENIYPKFRFTLSPLFQAQELVESPILTAMRGAAPRRVIDPEVSKVYGELLQLSPEYRTLDGAEYVTRLAGDEAVRRSFGANTLIGKALSRFDVKGVKEANRVAQIAAENPEAFRSALNDVNPKLWNTLQEAYQTTDPAQIVRSYVQERMAIARGSLPGATSAARTADEAAANAGKMLDAVKPTFSGADEETVWQAFKASFEDSARSAFTTHYFNPQRGFLERSLNHPYLGLYPLSYSVKMTGEFARFLLVRPFGLKAPLVGLAAAQRVQQAIVGQVAADPEGLGKFLKDHSDALYVMNLLLPYTPYDLGANAPAPLRHAITGKLGGNGLYKKGDLGARISGEATDMLGSIGLGRDIGLAAGVGSDVVSQLQGAAKALDGMFPPH